MNKVIIIVMVVIALVLILLWTKNCANTSQQKKRVQNMWEEKLIGISASLQDPKPIPWRLLKAKKKQLHEIASKSNLKRITQTMDVNSIIGLVDLHLASYEVGTIVKDWVSEKELSRNTVQKSIAFSKCTGDSLTVSYQTSTNAEAKAKKLYNEDYGTKDECMRIVKGEIWIGMSKEQLFKSRGRPGGINKTVGEWGTHEQLVYGIHGPYIYLENGVLTSWQD